MKERHRRPPPRTRRRTELVDEHAHRLLRLRIGHRRGPRGLQPAEQEQQQQWLVGRPATTRQRRLPQRRQAVQQLVLAHPSATRSPTPSSCPASHSPGPWRRCRPTARPPPRQLFPTPRPDPCRHRPDRSAHRATDALCLRSARGDNAPPTTRPRHARTAPGSDRTGPPPTGSPTPQTCTSRRSRATPTRAPRGQLPDDAAKPRPRHAITPVTATPEAPRRPTTNLADTNQPARRHRPSTRATHRTRPTGQNLVTTRRTTTADPAATTLLPRHGTSGTTRMPTTSSATPTRPLPHGPRPTDSPPSPTPTNNRGVPALDEIGVFRGQSGVSCYTY